MKDSRYDAADEHRKVIRSKIKRELTRLVDCLEECLMDETGVKRTREAREYILNRVAEKLGISHHDGVKGSNTEGHVSHVLSSHLNSRSMGWSRNGAGNMAQLRAYHLNGGNNAGISEIAKEGAA